MPVYDIHVSCAWCLRLGRWVIGQLEFGNYQYIDICYFILSVTKAH